jgi:ABC-type cobalamin/Fe3+-siderophores transport system ATPase subunit
MAINLAIRTENGAPLMVPLDDGQCVFVLGANGTGKSSLMHFFFAQHGSDARRISAHRQTWFSSNSLALTATDRRNTEQHIQNVDRQTQSRWKDDVAAQRANMAVYDLVEAENTRARRIAAAVDADDFGLAKSLRKKDAPIKIINELLRLSSIPIKVSVLENEQIMASKSGSAMYSIAELSDGERNALLIAANVLTVPPKTLLLIDEPERHLHRSIISPLLTLLFQHRSDCKFVVSTHDVLLPLDNPTARTLLIRSCEYDGATVKHWDVDLLPANAPVDEAIKRDILGSRRKVLFVEGDSTSLDQPLYSLVFPNVSVVAKGGSGEVKSAVNGIRGAPDLHWVQAFGLVDNDRRSSEEVSALKTACIHALDVYTVESIYYHPELQLRVAARHAVVTGEDAAARVAGAKAAILSAVVPHVKRLSSRAIEKSVRSQIDSMHPTQAQIAAGTPVKIEVDVAAELSAEQGKLGALVNAQDIQGIICRYPVRETPALSEIARRLGFQDREQYESAVRKLLMDDATALAFVRSLFGSLYSETAA